MGIIQRWAVTDFYHDVLAVWCLLFTIGRYYLYSMTIKRNNCE